MSVELFLFCFVLFCFLGEGIREGSMRGGEGESGTVKW